MGEKPDWRLIDFEPFVDRWINKEEPDQDLRNEVWSWIQGRLENPTYATRDVDGFPPAWRFAKIPNTVRGETVVTCTFVVDAHAETISCKILETLSLPV